MMSFCVLLRVGEGTTCLCPREEVFGVSAALSFLQEHLAKNYSETTMFVHVFLQFRRHFSPSTTILYLLQQCTVKFGQSVLHRSTTPNSKAFWQGKSLHLET